MAVRSARRPRADPRVRPPLSAALAPPTGPRYPRARYRAKCGRAAHVVTETQRGT